MNQKMIGKIGVITLGLLALNGALLKQAQALAIPIKQDQLLVEYLDAQDQPLSEMHGYSLEWLGFGAEFPIANRPVKYTEEFTLPGYWTATVRLHMDHDKFSISFEGKSGLLPQGESCEGLQVSDYIPNFESTTFYCGGESSEHAFKVRITNLSALERQKAKPDEASKNKSVTDDITAQSDRLERPASIETEIPSGPASTPAGKSDSDSGK